MSENSLKGKTPTEDEDFKFCVAQLFAKKDQKFYGRRIMRLPERWQKIIEQIVLGRISSSTGIEKSFSFNGNKQKERRISDTFYTDQSMDIDRQRIRKNGEMTKKVEKTTIERNSRDMRE
ncbi:hypothetical protein RB195_016898 [Necator americanus]|uniref:Uncharacterized protein n=1 Tax=Necator americanus TaxID=51031 RepID=A0ABR1C4W0_NECAM